MSLEPNASFRRRVVFRCLSARVISSSEGEAFFSQVARLSRIRFPAVRSHAQARTHAVVIVGHNWKQSASTTKQASSSHVWKQVETLLTVDDNLLPYSYRSAALARDSKRDSPILFTADAIDAFIVALPDKIYYPADAIDAYESTGRGFLGTLARGPGQEPLELRRYFITTVSRLREHAREYHSQLGDTLVGLMMRLDTAQFVWVVEYCTVTQWEAGRVAARAIVDATASPKDPVPIWLLHDEDVAHVFDRSSSEMQPTSISLDRTGLGPLPRIELNLRPVVESPAPTNTSAANAEPGGCA